MTALPLNQFAPGDKKIPAAILNEIVRQVAASSRISGQDGIDVETDGIGVRIGSSLKPPEFFVAKLTSEGTGGDAGSYAWTKQRSANTASGYEDDDTTGTVADDPAKALNGQTGLVANSLVVMFPGWHTAGSGTMKRGWRFLHMGAAGGGVEVLQIQSGAANSFGYPARVQTWNNSTGAWSDLNTTEVRVEDPNGGTWTAGDYVAVAKPLGPNTSAVDCYSGEPPGSGGGSLTVETDFPGATITGTNANPSVTTTTAMLVLPTAGTWELTLYMYYSTTAVASLNYFLREMTYGGGPASGSLVFFGPGAATAGDNAQWRFYKTQVATEDRWTVTAFVTASEDACQIGFDSTSLGGVNHQDQFLGGQTYGMSLTAVRIGDP